MKLDLFNSLLLIEAVAAPKEKVKPAKEPVVEPAKAEKSMSSDGDSLESAKKAFIFKTKFDQYDNLEQTEDQALRREMKRVYSIFGREHERSVVYGLTSGNEREFKRLARMLGISTDGEVTLERVKRAGFTLAGRIGTKRLMKRGDFIVSLVGPNDDQAPIAFYTSKPVEKVVEHQTDMFGATDHNDLINDLEAEAQALIDKHASQNEVNAFKKKVHDSLGHDSIDNVHTPVLGAAGLRIAKKLRAAGYKGITND